MNILDLDNIKTLIDYLNPYSHKGKRSKGALFGFKNHFFSKTLPTMCYLTQYFIELSYSMIIHSKNPIYKELFFIFLQHVYKIITS